MKLRTVITSLATLLSVSKTGLRRGELQALQWEDIELNDEYQIVVNVQYSWGLTETGYARKDKAK